MPLKETSVLVGLDPGYVDMVNLVAMPPSSLVNGLVINDNTKQRWLDATGQTKSQIKNKKRRNKRKVAQQAIRDLVDEQRKFEASLERRKARKKRRRKMYFSRRQARLRRRKRK